MIGVNLPELVGNGAWLDGRAARVEGAALHDPEDDNLANGDPIRISELAALQRLLSRKLMRSR